MFNSSLPDVLSKNFVGVVILCQEVKEEDILLSILLQYFMYISNSAILEKLVEIFRMNGTPD